MRDGTFREDLYYRLNVVTIQIPPLRERREDIPLLLEHFLRKFAEKNRREVTGLTAAARDAFLKYDYPGNIRELENLVERAVLLCRGRVIDLEDLPAAVRPGERSAGQPESRRLPDILGRIERQAIREALERCGGVQTQAARDPRHQRARPALQDEEVRTGKPLGCPHPCDLLPSNRPCLTWPLRGRYSTFRQCGKREIRQMATLQVPDSFPFRTEEVRIVTKAGAPTEVILTVEQFEQLLALIEELEDRADFTLLKDAPARPFDEFLKEL